MSTTPHPRPEPYDDALGLLAPPQPAYGPDPDQETEPDVDDSTEWGTAGERSQLAGEHQVAWHAEPSADDPWLDDTDVVEPSSGTLYETGPGLPSRGLVVVSGAAVAAFAGLDVVLTGGIGFFFDLCLVVLCLVIAMAAAPRALFTAAVLPPLVFGALVAVLAVAAPTTVASVATGSVSRVFLTGLAEHAVPLCIGYAVTLLVASARGIAHRAATR
jgi:hypothetical protein